MGLLGGPGLGCMSPDIMMSDRVWFASDFGVHPRMYFRVLCVVACPWLGSCLLPRFVCATGGAPSCVAGGLCPWVRGSPLPWVSTSLVRHPCMLASYRLPSLAPSPFFSFPLSFGLLAFPSPACFFGGWSGLFGLLLDHGVWGFLFLFLFFFPFCGGVSV